MATINTVPQIIYDIDHNFGQDITGLDGNNDLNTVSDLQRSQQRVLRRLMTNPGDYIWEPNYGAGLPSFVGLGLSQDRFDQIKSIITSQIFLEDSVAKDPAPQIFLQIIPSGLFVQINYTDNPTKQPIVLKFNVS